MTNTTKKRFISGRGAVLLVVAVALAAVLAVKYQQEAARQQAAELDAFCAKPATGHFSLKLACVSRGAQSRITP